MKIPILAGSQIGRLLDLMYSKFCCDVQVKIAKKRTFVLQSKSSSFVHRRYCVKLIRLHSMMDFEFSYIRPISWLTALEILIQMLIRVCDLRFEFAGMKVY